MSTLASLIINIKGDASELIEAVKKAQGEASSFTDKLKEMGPALAKAALGGGAAMAAIGTASALAADSAKSALTTLQTGFGLTADEAAGLKDTIVDTFKAGFGDSMSEAARAVGLVQQQLGDLGTEGIEEAAKSAFRLRDTFDVDLNESVDAAKTLMSNFGLSSEQAFDMLTAGLQQGLNRSGDFLDTIGEYSTQFANGGASASEFFNLLQSGMQGGMLGTDKAADAFKEFRVRIQDGSKTTSDALAQLGIDSADLAAKMANGTMTAADAFNLVIAKLNETTDANTLMQAGVGLLGTQFEDLGTKGALGLSLMGTGFDDVAGKTAALDVQYSSLGDLIEGLKRKAIVEWLQPMGEHLLTIANTTAPLAAAAFDQIGAGLSFLGEHKEILAGVAATIATVMVPAVVAWTAAEMAKTAAMIAGAAAFAVANAPLIAMAAAIGAVVAGAVLLVENWDTLTAKFPILATATEGVTTAFNAMKDAAALAWDGIKTAVETTIEAIKPLITLGMAVVQGDWSTAQTALKDLAQGAWDAITGLISTAIQAIPGLIAAGKDAITGAAAGIWDAVKSAASSAWDAVKALPGAAVAAIPGLISASQEAIVGAAGAIWTAVQTAATTAWDALKTTVTTKLGEAVTEVAGFPGRVVTALGSLATTLLSAGADLIQGLINGITSKIPDLDGIISGIASKIKSGIKDPLGIFSPSTVFHEYGMNTMQGFLNGLQALAPTVYGWVLDFASGLSGVVAAAVGGVMGGGGGGGGGGDDEQVPGQPAGVTWRQLRYQQGLAAAFGPGTLTGGDTYAEGAEYTTARQQMPGGKDRGWKWGPTGQANIDRISGRNRPIVFNITVQGNVIDQAGFARELAPYLNTALGVMPG